MADEIKGQEAVYATYRLWSEPEFVYHEYICHCSRSGIDPASLDDRPLSILTAVRRM
jgi:hypothetical protein